MEENRLPLTGTIQEFGTTRSDRSRLLTPALPTLDLKISESSIPERGRLGPTSRSPTWPEGWVTTKGTHQKSMGFKVWTLLGCVRAPSVGTECLLLSGGTFQNGLQVLGVVGVRSHQREPDVRVWRT